MYRPKIAAAVVLASCLILVSVLHACGSSDSIPNNAVVSVDGKSITKGTFNHWMTVIAPDHIVPDPPKYAACIAHTRAITPKPAKGQTAPTEAQLKFQCEQSYKTLQQEVLGFLISSEWAFGEAKALGVKVSDTEVNKELREIRHKDFPQPGQFESSGFTTSDLMFRVRSTLVSRALEHKAVDSAKTGTVTPAQVQAYYNEHKSQYPQKEIRSLQVILTKTEAQAKKAKQEIESGKKFETVAKRASIDATSARGGDLPEIEKGTEEKPLDKAFFSAKLGVLSGPVKMRNGYVIFRVEVIAPARKLALEAAQGQMISYIQQAALAKFKADQKKKWEAKTDCRSGYIVEDCKQYKALKVTSTTPTTTGN